ncbi:right-handed parallel beta-helix repeat-containing protein [Pseudoduganella buxea]|uniref:Right handed beta helix domain-containing protein n=1 Tax=Pseudoduganella buxea TaxID=1949069 RepID=A0A6I3SZ84_9BURK|nr:right-handed parallel beta-helix repeat-containing protein [Pseudoduganella buxea]MTV52857.1 hypothetical protein [Pseudoduganella buxea]GGC02495.1 hypothetical protein GCM10011572_25530 [Pseudoduganella buxea]
MNNPSHVLFAIFAALALCSCPQRAGAVDGVVVITQARAIAGGVTPGDEPGFPVTISQPGSYRLASNLHVTASETGAIVLAADHVEVDLNGFTIFGPGKDSGHSAGIGAENYRGNYVVLRNGAVRSMGGDGVSLGWWVEVDEMSSMENGGNGIAITEGRVSRSRAIKNGRIGFLLYSTSQITRSIASENGRAGIVHYGGLISDSIIQGNMEAGIESHGNVAYWSNRIDLNQTGNVVGPSLELGANICGRSTACQ